MLKSEPAITTDGSFHYLLSNWTNSQMVWMLVLSTASSPIFPNLSYIYLSFSSHPSCSQYQLAEGRVYSSRLEQCSVLLLFSTHFFLVQVSTAHSTWINHQIKEGKKESSLLSQRSSIICRHSLQSKSYFIELLLTYEYIIQTYVFIILWHQCLKLSLGNTRQCSTIKLCPQHYLCPSFLSVLLYFETGYQ